MSEARRAAITAAFEASEKEEASPPAEKVEEQGELFEQPTEKIEAVVETTPETIEEKSSETPPVEKVESTEKVTDKAPAIVAPVAEKPPQSWKPAERAKWNALDPGVRAEVLRREREVTQVLNETAQVRKFAQEFQQVIAPFSARMQAMNAHPLVAVRELLKADYLLSTSPKVQKAQFLAKLISDYDVDIAALDEVLSGKQVQDDPTARFEQIIDKKLAPIITANQQREQQTRQQDEQEFARQIAAFEDEIKYPYFQQVRGDMADIIELSAKKGVHVTLESAYNKAVQLDPVISADLATRKKATSAALANAEAQRALRASSSVRGAPTIAPVGSPTGGNRRAAIEAAMESVSSR